MRTLASHSTFIWLPSRHKGKMAVDLVLSQSTLQQRQERIIIEFPALNHNICARLIGCAQFLTKTLLAAPGGPLGLIGTKGGRNKLNELKELDDLNELNDLDDPDDLFEYDDCDDEPQTRDSINERHRIITHLRT